MKRLTRHLDALQCTSKLHFCMVVMWYNTNNFSPLQCDHPSATGSTTTPRTGHTALQLYLCAHSSFSCGSDISGNWHRCVVTLSCLLLRAVQSAYHMLDMYPLETLCPGELLHTLSSSYAHMS